MKVVFLTSQPEGDAAYRFLKARCPEVYISGDRPEELPPYDLGISFLYHYKIPASELGRVWVNFHPAPLPNYRGRNVAYHAIMNGEHEFGATIHYIDKDFDTGDIIECRTFPIEPWYTAGNIAALARQMCLDLFKEYIPRFLAGEKVPATPQGEGMYYSKQPIDDIIKITGYQERRIRALTAPPHHARIVIEGTEYVIC